MDFELPEELILLKETLRRYVDTKMIPIERMWRQQRSYRITEGPSEVMKMVIARHVLNTYG